VHNKHRSDTVREPHSEINILTTFVMDTGDAGADRVSLDGEADAAHQLLLEVTVDFDRSLESMITEGRYDWTNPDVTKTNFPYKAKGVSHVKVHLICFGDIARSEEVMQNLARASLRPATLPELLACGTIHPELQKESPVAALGSVWSHPCGGHQVPILWTGQTGRRLDLYWLENGWGSDCRFAAIDS
jgi:hypothetical protein